MPYANPFIEMLLGGTVSLFAKLSQKEKESIASHSSILQVKKGKSLVREGDKSKGVFFLVSGRIKLFRVGAGGREQILRLLKQGEMLGCTALLAEKYWLFSAVAMTDVTVCLLEKNTLLNIVRKNAELSLKLTELLSNELLYAYRRTISLTQKHVRARLAETLLTLAEIYGYEEDGITLQSALSRDDIAHFSNMTTSNAIRTLSNFASEKVIILKRRKIGIPDINLLIEISENG